MAFVRSGYANTNSGETNNVGDGGWVWSRTASGNPSYAYRLTFYSTNVDSSGNGNRYNAFPLR